MQVTKVSKHGRSTTTISVSYGVIGDFLGVFAGLGVFIIGVVFLVIFVSGWVVSIKEKDFIDTQATVTVCKQGDSFNKCTISYMIDNKNYFYDDFYPMDDVKVGDTLSIRYDPNDYSNINWGDKNVNPIFLFIAIIFIIVGLSTAIRNAKNVLHFINPTKYEAGGYESIDNSIYLGDNLESTSSIGNPYENLPEGDSKQIRF